MAAAFATTLHRVAGLVFLAGYFFIAFAESGFNIRGYAPGVVGLFLVYTAYACLALAFLNKLLPAPSARQTILLSAACVIILIFAIPIPKTDFYHYFFEDVAWLYQNKNPFLITPSDLPTLEISQLSGWEELASQHGPARIYSSLPAALASAGSPVWGVFFYKTIFAAFMVGSMMLVYELLRKFSTPRLNEAFFVIALSPLVIYETQLSGGTDIIMTFWLLLSLVLLVYKRPWWAIAALTASFLTKYITVLLVPFWLWYIAASQPTIFKKVWSIVRGGALVSALTVAAFAPFWAGPKIFVSTVWVARHFEINSVPGAIGLLISIVHPINFETLTLIFTAGFIIFYATVFAWFVFRSDASPRHLAVSSALVIAALLIAKSWLYMKYLIWLLPLVSLLGPGLQPLVIFLSGAGIFAAVQPDIVMLYLLPPTLVFSAYYFTRDSMLKKTR